MKTGPLDSLSKHLAILLDSSSLPASSISKADRQRLQSLFDAGVIEEVRSGAGRRLIVTNQTALRAFILAFTRRGWKDSRVTSPQGARRLQSAGTRKRLSGRTRQYCLPVDSMTALSRRMSHGCPWLNGPKVRVWRHFAWMRWQDGNIREHWASWRTWKPSGISRKSHRPLT